MIQTFVVCAVVVVLMLAGMWASHRLARMFLRAAFVEFEMLDHLCDCREALDRGQLTPEQFEQCVDQCFSSRAALRRLWYCR